MGRYVFFAVIFTALAAGYSCAIVHSRPELNDFTQQCTHCHGERLEGVRNTAHRCCDCHELKPIAASEVTSKIRRDAIMSEPHVHKGKNMFGGTPSCFSCHRFGSI